MSRQVAVLTLPAELDSVRTARHALLSICREAGLPADLVRSGELLVSEVVTNAVIHGRSEVTVEVAVTDLSLRVDVSDDGRGVPQVQPVDDGGVSGRGLRIVALLAADWGITDRSAGKTVWFELTVP